MLDIGKLFKDPAFKFKREEFVHPSIITSVGMERCLYYISDFQVNYAMLLREVLQAPVIINTWHYKKAGRWATTSAEVRARAPTSLQAAVNCRCTTCQRFGRFFARIHD